MARVRTIKDSESLDGIEEELVYTEALLLKNPLTRPLASGHAGLLKRIEAVRQGQRRAARGVVVANAGVAWCDAALDQMAERVEVKLITAEESKRKSPRLHRYFPEGASVSVVRRLALGAQIQRMREWPESLKGEPEAELKSLAKPLAADIAAGEQALRERASAERARTDHRVREILPFVDDVNAERLGVMSKLLGIAAQKRLGKPWAERFFRHSTRRVEAASGDGDEGGGQAEPARRTVPSA